MLRISGAFTDRYIDRHNKTIASLKKRINSSQQKVDKYFNGQKQHKYGHLNRLKQNVIALQKIKDQNEREIEEKINEDNLFDEDRKVLTKMFMESKMQL